MLPIDDTVTAAARPGDFLDGYFEHLIAGDLEGSIAMFEPDGYIQHSNGVRYQGAQRIREDYTNMFKANGGQIMVKFANVTDDGERRAFECVMPSGRPAVAVYERGPTGRIAALRISL
jgi:predicted SnoaL-like aldol condensation-catalyzing enzyme